MDAKHIIALVVTIIAAAVWFKLHRIVVRFTPRQRQVNTIWIQSIMTGFTIGMYWSVGIWTWIAVTALMLILMAREWLRFLNTAVPEESVNPPAPDQDGPYESN